MLLLKQVVSMQPSSVLLELVSNPLYAKSLDASRAASPPVTQRSDALELNQLSASQAQVLQLLHGHQNICNSQQASIGMTICCAFAVPLNLLLLQELLLLRGNLVAEKLLPIFSITGQYCSSCASTFIGNQYEPGTAFLTFLC